MVSRAFALTTPNAMKYTSKDPYNFSLSFYSNSYTHLYHRQNGNDGIDITSCIAVATNLYHTSNAPSGRLPLWRW
jgi:hypothetical protein